MMWRNWSGSESALPHRVVSVADEGEIRAIVGRAGCEGRRVRAVGASHSFMPVAATDGYLLRLDGHCGVVGTRELGNGNTAVTVRSGTRLRDLAPALERRGLALANQGDVDPQSLAGAVSTGTHGTGLGFTGFAGMVLGFRLVLADGGVVECSADQNSDLFEFARVGLGSFGVVSEITIECVPRFGLHAIEKPEPLDDVLDSFVQRCYESDHFEFYWFPYTSLALTKTNTRVDYSEALRCQESDGRFFVRRVRNFIDDEVLGNLGYEAVCRAGAWFPSLVPQLNEFSAHGVASREYTDRAYKVFVSDRRVRFNEMEYAIPLEDLPEVFRELKSAVEKSKMPIEFPWEVRCAGADDVPLSTAYGRKSAYIAMHRYWKKEYKDYFALCEPILKAAGGRPHWGKIHTLGREDLIKVHPGFERADAIRHEADPAGMFLNEWTGKIFS